MSAQHVIGITAHRTKAGASEALQAIVSMFQSRGFSCVVDEETAFALGWLGKSLPFEDFLDYADLFISLGGDGTLLQIAARVAPTGKLIAGVNFGRLGFLTACDVDHVGSLIKSLENETYYVEDRSLLEVSVVEEETSLGDAEVVQKRYLALNEVSIMKATPGRMVDLQTFLNGEFLTNYHADGLLVATATGSTAYSLAAGGPIISPKSGVFCLTPVSPHSLTNRSLIIADSSVVGIRPRKKEKEDSAIVFSIDGHEIMTLEDGAYLQVNKASCRLNLVRLSGYSFPELLRAKLSWRGAEV